MIASRSSTFRRVDETPIIGGMVVEDDNRLYFFLFSAREDDADRTRNERYS